MRKRVGALAGLVAVVAVMSAAPLAKAADFNPAAGAYTVDTTGLTITGPGVLLFGSDLGGVAVFSFDNVNVPPGAVFTVTGIRPFRLVATGNMTIAGVFNGSGQSATNGLPGPIPGGPGGGAGGKDVSQPGSGPGGGGVASNTNNGGGGGGFGGSGAAGGVKVADPGTAGSGGAAYGDLSTSFQGGSGGGGATLGGGGVGGGGGGGALGFFASSLTVTPGGAVLALGGGGAVGGFGASGGGSGGAIVLHAETLEVNGLLSVEGGAGGAGGCCGDGGGGGGGRIAYEYRTLISSGTAVVAGGLSGVRSTSGSFPHGGLSPQVSGAPGTIGKTQAPIATTGPATGVSSSGATLNGTVNPNSHPTTYRFQYGTTSSYGSSAPASPAPVGSDGSDHVVSQALTGLAPNTTYHYRVVATDALGFTTVGVDVGFTTNAAAVPAPVATTTSKAPNTKISKATIDSAKGKATFKFKAEGSATGFKCALAKKGKKLKYKSCRSPKTYKELKEGKYTFAVKAIGAGGSDETPAKRNFQIKPQ